MTDERLEIALETLELYATGQEIDTLGPHDAKALLRHIEAQREVVEAAREAVRRMESDKYPNDWPNIKKIRARLREALDNLEVQSDLA